MQLGLVSPNWSQPAESVLPCAEASSQYSWGKVEKIAPLVKNTKVSEEASAASTDKTYIGSINWRGCKCDALRENGPFFTAAKDADCGTARRGGKGKWPVYQALAPNEAICRQLWVREDQVHPFEWVLETPDREIHSTRTLSRARRSWSREVCTTELTIRYGLAQRIRSQEVIDHRQPAQPAIR